MTEQINRQGCAAKHIPVFGRTDFIYIVKVLFLETEGQRIRMESWMIRENETLEDLQLQGLRLIQKKDGFRFGMDSVLLADFARIGQKDLVADFGTGSGVLPLLLIGRDKGACFECFEIQEAYAEMAQRTMALNRLGDRVHIVHGDAAKAFERIEGCSTDAVICNPPYGIPGTGLSSPFISRAIARNQDSDTMKGFLKSAFRILKGRGKFITVYPAPRMLYLMRLMQEAHLEPKRFQLVYPEAEKAANLVLIEAVKDAKPMLHPMEPLIIYNKDHTLTNRLKSVYNIEEQEKG